MRTGGCQPRLAALAAALALFPTLGAGAETATSEADLYVTTFSVDAPSPLSVVPRQTSTPVRIVVANGGGTVARDVVVEFGEIQATGYRKVLGTFLIAAIEPGSAGLVQTVWNPYVDKVGDFDLVATVDPLDRIAESDDLNNVRHARATSRLPMRGAIFPARSALSPLQGPVFVGGEWIAYHFDDFDRHNPIRGLLLDRSGNGRDAVLPPDVAFDAGVAGLGARFDGRTVYDVDWTGAVGAGQGMAVSLWLKIDQRPRFGQYVWSAPAGECQRQGVELRPEGGIRLWSATASGACVNFVESRDRLVPGQWAHVVATWAGGTALLYVNARPQDAQIPSGGPLPVRGGLYLGALNTGGAAQTPTAYLDGAVVDEFRVYQRALSAADVAAIYALGQRVYVV